MHQYFIDCFQIDFYITAIHNPDISYFRCYGNYSEKDIESIKKIYPKTTIYSNQKISVSFENSINMINMLRFDFEQANNYTENGIIE